MIVITTKRGKSSKIKNNYLWLFSDEIKEIIGDARMGIANLFSEEGEFLGKGLFNRNSKKTFRLLSHEDNKIDMEFFIWRFRKALDYRKRFYNSNVYRMINAESDMLPGLIIDRYNDYFVIQIRHPVLEEYKSHIIDALVYTFKNSIKGIFERSDFESSPESNLKRNIGILYGEIPEIIRIEENGIKYDVRLLEGQKTGFFMDQKDTRTKSVELATQFGFLKEKALDLFCYTGSFALNLAKAGMYATGIDKSSIDIETAKGNAALNELSDKTEFHVCDAFTWDNKHSNEYRMIIIDPPSLIKEKKEIPYGKRLFTSLMAKGIKMLKKPGIIGLCSCAYHIGWNELEESIRRGCADTNTKVTIVSQNIQSLDHPWMMQMPESLYLKCYWAYIDKN